MDGWWPARRRVDADEAVDGGAARTGVQRATLTRCAHVHAKRPFHSNPDAVKSISCMQLVLVCKKEA